MQRVPVEDAPVCVAKGTPAYLKPSIDPIETSQTYLEFVWFAGSHRWYDHQDRAREILGVDHVARAPLLEFLQRPTAVLDDLGVDRLDLTGRRENRHQTWNAIDDQPRTMLAFAEGFFCPPALGNLLGQLLIGRGKLARSLRDAFVELFGDSLLFVQEVCLLQPDRHLVRGDVEK